MNDKQTISSGFDEPAADDTEQKECTDIPEETTVSADPVSKDAYAIYREYLQKEEEKMLAERKKQEAIYAVHGITQDKMEGALQYQNAAFKGMAMLGSGLTVLMIVACALICGITSNITIFAIAAFAIEGTLLAQEERQNVPMRILARVFFLFPLTMTLVLLILYLAQVPVLVQTIVMIVFGSLSILLTGFGSILYYIYNPYRKQAKQIRAAKAQIRQLKKETEKEQKKTKKKSAKQKKKEQKRLRRLERKENRQREKRQLREFARAQREKAQKLAEKMKHHQEKQ